MQLTGNKAHNCSRCGAAIANAVVNTGDRVDDLMRRSAIASQIRTDHTICATCQKISLESQHLDELIPKHQRESLFGEVKPVLPRKIPSVNVGDGLQIWKYVAFGFFIIYAAIKFFSASDDQPADVPELITFEEDQIDTPTKILDGDSAVPFNSPAQWVGPNDYPRDALRDEREGTTQFELTVSEQGKVSACNIIVSSGHDDLDEATCKAIMKRANFYKGLNESDIPIPSKYSNRVKWEMP